MPASTLAIQSQAVGPEGLRCCRTPTERAEAPKTGSVTSAVSAAASSHAFEG
ncbi:hypothetical protein D3C83_314730 [compost metagenome]